MSDLLRCVGSQGNDAHGEGFFAISGHTGPENAAITTVAIAIAETFATIGAPAARSAAIDVGFSAIHDLIRAGGCFARPSHTHVAITIEPYVAGSTRFARQAIATATIDIRFLAIGDIVGARRRSTCSVHADLTLAIRTADAGISRRTSRAIATATIDVRFQPILDRVRTLRRRTCIGGANTAHALRVVDAFDTITKAIAKLCSIASRACGVILMRRARTDACVERTWISVIGRVRRIGDLDDIAFAITGFALAITHGLKGNRRTHG